MNSVVFNVMTELIQRGLGAALSYPAYRQHLTDLLAEGKTTGPNQSEFYLNIANLNQRRMDRLDRRTTLTPELATAVNGLKKAYTLLVLTEGWCGDAAQILPVLHKAAEASDQLDLQLILRDEHLELMDLYLTDNGRSIPKVLVIDAGTKKVVANWGPRPAPAQQLAMDYKYRPAPKPSYDAHHLELHAWYTKDKTMTIQAELTALISDLAKIVT